MRRDRAVLTLVCAALVGLNASAVQAVEGGDLKWALPAPAALGSLSSVGEPQQATTEGLWELINGGAGVYLRAGFERVILQEYKSKAGVRYGLELYAMKTPDGAQKVFEGKGGKQQARPEIGQGSTLADYYGFVWQGRFFISVTAYEQTDETTTQLKQLARAVVEKLKTTAASRPALTR